jgi:hypothetical protein
MNIYAQSFPHMTNAPKSLHKSLKVQTIPQLDQKTAIIFMSILHKHTFHM